MGISALCRYAWCHETAWEPLALVPGMESFLSESLQLPDFPESQENLQLFTATPVTHTRADAAQWLLLGSGWCQMGPSSQQKQKVWNAQSFLLIRCLPISVTKNPRLSSQTEERFVMTHSQRLPWLLVSFALPLRYVVHLSRAHGAEAWLPPGSQEIETQKGHEFLLCLPVT